VNADGFASFGGDGLKEEAQDQRIKKGAKERPVDRRSEISRKERSRDDNKTRTPSNIDIQKRNDLGNGNGIQNMQHKN